MELYIETLTGTIFELRVSPFETIFSVKSKIQRLEGIPISYQHLIWQSVELGDEYCLYDYQIYSGAILKLVLKMRGGPINTRRIPVDDCTIMEMAEYMEANKDDILDRLPENSNITLLVFRDGDQLSFFRVVDRGDGTLTPLSESMSPSVDNVNEEHHEEESVISMKVKEEENNKMREKVEQLRVNMGQMNISKKQIPKPPSVPPPFSNHRHPTGCRKSLRQFPTTDCHNFSHTLNKNSCLPPVGQTFCSSASQCRYSLAPLPAATCFTTDPLAKVTAPVSSRPSVNRRDLSMVSSLVSTGAQILRPGNLDGDVEQTVSGSAGLSAAHSGASSPVLVPSMDTTVSALQMQPFSCDDQQTDGVYEAVGDVLKRSCFSGHKEVSVRGSFSRPPFKYLLGSERGMDALSADNGSTCDVQSMSVLLHQSPLDRLDVSGIDGVVSSTSKCCSGNFPGIQQTNFSPPEHHLLSRMRFSANNVGDHILSPTHRLPPVQVKKKANRRCYVCARKTGLASTYQCRCGNNFCATHRYAESHDCTFDYKTEGRKLLEQTHPVVNAPKLRRI